MTKKRLLLVASFPLAVVLIIGVLAMLPSLDGVTEANFCRIKHGMTKAEVEQIFGREGDIVVYGMNGDQRIAWNANEGGEFQIIFRNGCVIVMDWHYTGETFPDKIRRWLHLP
jgi:hypothetical protein